MTDISMSSNISLLFKCPVKEKNAIIEPKDPGLKYDLKKHLENRLDYRKQRIEWAKTKPGNWSLFRRKDVFFEEWAEDNLPGLQTDIKAFIGVHPGLTPSQAANEFCLKWRGYSNTYGVEFIERLMRIL